MNEQPIKSIAEQKRNDVVFIGEKPLMNYVSSLVMVFTVKGANSVVVKARGKHIAKAVDVVEAATKRFLEKSVATDKIDIGSDDFTNKQGRKVRVSWIEVTLNKKQ